MLTITEMRLALDEATEGGLYALNMVSKSSNLTPHVWVQTNAAPGSSRVLFYATNEQGLVRYFDSALTPADEVRDTQILMMERMREIEKRTAQIQAGLARLDEGLDPDYESPDPSLN